MQYNLAGQNMHNYILYITLLKKYALRLHIIYIYILYNFTKTNMHPYILDITLVKKIMHPACYWYNMWG